MVTAIHVNGLTKTYRVHKRPPGAMNALRDLFARKYEYVRALADVSFSLDEGEVVGYIGPNGAGKTTTLKILSGILHQTGGEVRVLGFTPQKRRREFLTSIAFLMGQKSQLWWDLPPIETFLLNREIYRIPTPAFRDRLEELVMMLSVSKLVNVPVRQLSLGERMKMEVIASLLHQPKVLFLDEPTIGLDLLSQDAIREFLLDYNRAHRATILVTSHYVRDIEFLCRRIMIIHRGSIYFDGDKTSMLHKFLRDRIVEVRFVHPVHDAGYPAGVPSTDKRAWRFRVPSEQVRNVMQELSGRHEIAEMTVDEPKLEDVLKEAYRRADLRENPR